jgi:hypothetical protein
MKQKKAATEATTFLLGPRRGSNPRQPESQSGTLPTELRDPFDAAKIAVSWYPPNCFRFFFDKKLERRVFGKF